MPRKRDLETGFEVNLNLVGHQLKLHFHFLRLWHMLTPQILGKFSRNAWVKTETIMQRVQSSIYFSQRE